MSSSTGSAVLPLVLVAGLVTGATSCRTAPASQTEIERTPGVAYQPRGFREFPTQVYPSRASVREDLEMLHDAGFRRLVTYGAMDVLADVPRIARDVGFDAAIVMGIWDPFSPEELNNARAAAPFVDGFCVGNEGLGERYDEHELAPQLDYLRQATGKPVTTSEPIDRYLDGPYREWLHEHSDWLFPNVHPYFGGLRTADDAAAFVVARHDALAVVANGKRVVLKEVGFPTHRDDCCSEAVQRRFFERLHTTRIDFLHFEAFDQPFKRRSADEPDLEHHWGLFDAQGRPKLAVDWLRREMTSREP